MSTLTNLLHVRHCEFAFFSFLWSFPILKPTRYDVRDRRRVSERDRARERGSVGLYKAGNIILWVNVSAKTTKYLSACSGHSFFQFLSFFYIQMLALITELCGYSTCSNQTNTKRKRMTPHNNHHTMEKAIANEGNTLCAKLLQRVELGC